MEKKRGNPHKLRVPTSQEARENGRKGGIASVAARKKKKDIRERINALLFSAVGNEQIKEQIRKGLGLEANENIDVVVAALFQKAMTGDVQAIGKLLEWGKLIDPTQLEVTGGISITDEKLSTVLARTRKAKKTKM